jgi:hypothetical protein
MVSFLLVFPLITYSFILTIHVTWNAHLILLDSINLIIHTLHRVQITKVLIRESSTTFCQYLSHRSKYSPQPSVLKHPQSVLLPYSQRPSFPTIKNHRQDYNRAYSDVYFSGLQTKRQKNGVFCDVTPCGSCKKRRFGGT